MVPPVGSSRSNHDSVINGADLKKVLELTVFTLSFSNTNEGERRKKLCGGINKLCPKIVINVPSQAIM